MKKKIIVLLLVLFLPTKVFAFGILYKWKKWRDTSLLSGHRVYYTIYKVNGEIITGRKDVGNNDFEAKIILDFFPDKVCAVVKEHIAGLEGPPSDLICVDGIDGVGDWLELEIKK